jgi:mannan endo-1,4-beta-mannosidase
MTWSQTWSGNFLEKTTTEMWKRNLDDERIIALDDMPGWDNVKADIRMARRIGSNNLAVNMQGKQITVSIAHAGAASIALFDMLGHKVASLAQGNLPAGNTAFNLDGIASGHYIVRAKVGSTSLAKKISIK